MEAWLKTIKIDADRVLDVGGSANPVIHRLKDFRSNEYMIVDNGLEELKNKPDILADLNNEDFANYMTHIQPFDVVFCLEVMEYIWNPAMAMRNLRSTIKKDGIIYITFPFVYPDHNPPNMDYLRYTPHGAKRLLVEYGFEIVDIQYRTGNHLLAEFYATDRMRGRRDGVNHLITGTMIKARAI